MTMTMWMVMAFDWINYLNYLIILLDIEASRQPSPLQAEFGDSS